MIFLAWGALIIRKRRAMLEYLVPVPTEPNESLWVLLRALLDWRHSGYATAADTVIDLLANPGDMPKDDLLWSLQCVSGHA
jgi:hypothetical protein